MGQEDLTREWNGLIPDVVPKTDGRGSFIFGCINVIPCFCTVTVCPRTEVLWVLTLPLEQWTVTNAALMSYKDDSGNNNDDDDDDSNTDIIIATNGKSLQRCCTYPFLMWYTTVIFLWFSALDGRFMTPFSCTNFCLQPLSLAVHRTCWLHHLAFVAVSFLL